MACALRIVELAPQARVLLLELGRGLGHRPCPVDKGFSCTGCGGTCNVLSGVGGCIHSGDGSKLSQLPSGKRLLELLGEEFAEQLCSEATELVEASLGRRLTFVGESFSHEHGRMFDQRGVRLTDYPVAVLTEEEVAVWQLDWYDKLARTCEVRVGARAERVDLCDGGVSVTYSAENTRSVAEASAVVLATGRAGITWTSKELSRLKVRMKTPIPSIGVRYEMNAQLLEVAGLRHPDLKASIETRDGRKAKSFCFCGGSNGGRIKFTHYQTAFSREIITLDGHVTSRRRPGPKSLAGNFGILTQVPDEAGSRMQYFIDDYSSRFNGRPVFESLGSFAEGSYDVVTEASRTDSLSFDPSVRDVQAGPLHMLYSEEERLALLEGFQTVMEGIHGAQPRGVYNSDVLVMGPEIEFLWPHPEMDSTGRLGCGPIWVVGDAAGVAQGILQAVMFGLAAGGSIADIAVA